MWWKNARRVLLCTKINVLALGIADHFNIIVCNIIIIIIVCNVQRTFRQWLSSLFIPTSEGQVAAQDVVSSRYYIDDYYPMYTHA